MKMSQLRAALCRSSNAVWCIQKSRRSALAHAVAAAHTGNDAGSIRAALDIEGVEIEIETDARRGEPQIIPGARGGKATAIVSMRGTALYDMEFQPYVFSTALLAQRVKALANDPQIGLIVLDIDTPGGVVTGVPEAADAVYAAAQRKKVVAIVNPLCASAGYWIASQASEIVAVPSANIGSIGVYQLHWDDSEYWASVGMKPEFIEAPEEGFKTEGNMFEPLSGESRDYLQGEVNKIYRQFTAAVARGRKVERTKVETDFGMGRTFAAADAKRAGMIDAVATVDAALARYKLSPMHGDGMGAFLVCEGAEVYDSRADGGQVDSAMAVGNESVELFIPQAEIALKPEMITIHRIGEKHYVAEDWPSLAQISEEFFTSPSEFAGMSVSGAENEILRIEVANGFAEYRGESTGDSMVTGVLIRSEFTGRPPKAETGDDFAEPAPEATPEERMTESEVNARRLRLLELE